jgi:hypothetical protein
MPRHRLFPSDPKPPLHLEAVSSSEGTVLFIFSAFLIVTPVLAITLWVPHYISNPESFAFTLDPIPFTSLTYFATNAFVSLGLRLARRAETEDLVLSVSIQLLLLEQMPFGAPVTVVNSTLLRTVTFAGYSTASPYIDVYTAPIIDSQNYSGTVAVGGDDLSELTAIAILWRAGDPRMSQFIDIARIIFATILVCSIGLYCFDVYSNCKCVRRGNAFAFLVLALFVRVAFWRFYGFGVVVPLLVSLAHSLALRVGIVFLLWPPDSRHQCFIFVLVVIVVDEIVAEVVAAVEAGKGWLTGENIVDRTRFAVEVIFAAIIVVRHWSAPKRGDAAQVASLSAYARVIGLSMGVVLLGRAVHAFLLNVTVRIIGEIAIMAGYLGYALPMMYVHWPTHDGGRAPRADLAGLSAEGRPC